MSDGINYIFMGNSFMRKGVLPLALVLGMAGSFHVAAQAQPAAVLASKAVTVELKQFKVVKDAKGVEQLVDAPSVLPGDVVEYRVTYKNTTTKAVGGLKADLPIPDGLEYLPASAQPGASLVQAAAKDGVYAAEPLQRKLANGKAEALPYNEYRALRWSLGQLPAGGVTAVSARARVEKVVAPAAKVASVARLVTTP